MNQLSDLESLPETTATEACSPLLRDVLSSLDVQLEEELLQYRRRRPLKNERSPRAKKSSQDRKTLDLISIKADGSKTQVQTSPETTPQSLPKFLSEQNTTPQPTIQEASNFQPHSPTQLQIPAGNAFGTEEAASSVYPAGLASAYTPAAPSDSANDYLESSEALLKNIDEEKADDEPESSRANKLLTPLGVGSILLLLVGTSTLAYIAFNPSTISHISSRLFGSQTSKVAENPSNTTTATTRTVVNTEIPNSPNLADKEFVELNLRTLSTVNPRSSALNQSTENPRRQVPVNRPAPLPNPPGSSRLDLPSALLPPSIQSGILPATSGGQPIPTAPPRLAPTVANKQQAGQSQAGRTQIQVSANKPKASSSPRENRYLVVTTYNGDRSLAEAQKAVPDAIVRQLPAGKAIQLAAFPSESEAEKKVEALRKKGVSAKVYRR